MGQLYVVIRQHSMFDRLVQIDSAEALIGRRDTCELWLPDGLVSREHAALTKGEDGYCIRDLASRNGTYLNGKRLQNLQMIHDGSEVRVGPYCLHMNFQMTQALREVSNSEDETCQEDGPAAILSNSKQEASRLTAAQNRVYSLLLEGQQEKEVATSLGISIHTVHWHVKAIYRTFSVATRGELLARGLRR
ncbi:MAG: FHA domain-containing protein [Planctomycetes bacterium]|nr:FHA domain-containing protein [Planctomycetota bacterium]